MVEGSSPFFFLVCNSSSALGAVTLQRRCGLVGSGLPLFAAWKNGPSAAVLTIASVARAIWTPVKHRFGNEVT